LIVVSYIEGREICKQDDLSLPLFFSFSLSLFLFCYLIGTDDDRLFSLITRGRFYARLKTNFLFIPSGVAGLLLFVYARIIVQALTCKLPMAYCTCNSFSTTNQTKEKIDSWNR
jgi:hypothetical protein